MLSAGEKIYMVYIKSIYSKNIYLLGYLLKITPAVNTIITI